jgi:lipopolysaccharide biosynthesis glycosyltransferase
VEEVFAFAQAEKWQLLDQDVLNYFCQGRVRFVDMAWNVMFDNGGFRISDIISHTTPELYDAYLSAREAPKIVLYTGPFKPWMDPICDFGHIFWHYARMTAFYEMMILRELREAEERTNRRIDEVDAYIHAVDAELLRYEHRPVSLMLKEFCYQKVLMPVANALFKSDASHDKAEHLYRKIHPKKNTNDA